MRQSGWNMKRLLLGAVLVFGLMFVGAGDGFGQSVSVAGEWAGEFSTPGGVRPFSFKLEVEGEKLTGTVKRPSGDVHLTGTLKGDRIEFSYTISYGGNDLTLDFSGEVEGDSMSGIVVIGNTEDAWQARRVKK
jgi:hypothetical protein